MLLEADAAIDDCARPSFDMRPQAELAQTILAHPDPMERERALWELGYRSIATLPPLLHEVLQNDPDSAVRSNALSLALKVAPDDAPALLHTALNDPDSEVRDWARQHLRRLTGAKLPGEYTGIAYTEEGPFDQTMVLQMAGVALLHVPALGWLRVTLSPLWFEHVMGRVLACMRLETFPRELTVETRLAGYHDDGSSHYEVFPFAGVSWTSGDLEQHRHESTIVRKFHPSGKLDDRSKGVLDVPLVLHRTMTTSPVAVKALPPLQRESAHTETRRSRLLTGHVTAAIDGRFFAFAHTSVEQYVRHGKVLPGTVQLVSPTHPVSAPFVNTYLYGTFWGKLSDHDGDGKIDLNTIPCRGLTDAHVDPNDIAWPPDFPA